MIESQHCGECGQAYTMCKCDGLGGTDNIQPLFPERPSAAPLPPQPEVVQLLEESAVEAATGKTVGVMVFAFDGLGNNKVATAGKIPFSDGIASLEQLKFQILAEEYGKRLSAMGPRK